MKRVIALLLVVLMAVSLCGCSKEQSKGPEPGTALNTFYQAIMEAQPENAEELILFEESVADIFQARIDMGADNTNYPESAAGWQLYAQVQKSGNFVCMIVLPGGYVIPENVFES